MTRAVSETSLVSNSSPVQLENSQITITDEDENSNIVDISEYCPNREVVNLENAAVNIDNSTDVIIGPVTQFNVNGNFTFVSNGNDAVNGTLVEGQQPRYNLANGAKLGKTDKADSEDHDQKNFDKHKKTIRIFVSISCGLLILIGVVVLALHYTKNLFNDNSDSPPPYPGNGGGNMGSHQVLDRTQWGGRDPKSYENITSPVPMVIIKHTGGRQCMSFQACAGTMQTIQSNSVADGLPDIKYNFLIGGDGNIYVGRGWGVQPQQRRDTVDIAFMGSYAFDKLSSTMIDAAKLLIEDGVKRNKLTKDYILVAHNQTMTTESPGVNVFQEIVTWPHYDGGNHMGESLINGTQESF